MASRYRGVTRPTIKGKIRGWVAQSKVAGVWRSGFTSQEQAAEWLASKLGVKKASLRKARHVVVPETYGMSRYIGVVPHRHTRDGTRRWAARVPGHWLGTFGCQTEAARAVARQLGVRLRTLLRKNMFSAKHARKVFKAAYRVFHAYIPGDLKHTRLQEVRCRIIFQKDSRCQASQLSASKHLTSDSLDRALLMSYTSCILTCLGA